MNETLTALLGYCAWFIVLSLVMLVYRTARIGAGTPANAFSPSGAELPPLGQRITRARDNCFETLPIFVAIAVAANATARFDVTDPLAMWVLYARIGQSLVHLASTSVPAVMLRAVLFFAQPIVYAWWIWQLLG